jgi:hypothetical protein
MLPTHRLVASVARSYSIFSGFCGDAPATEHDLPTEKLK